MGYPESFNEIDDWCRAAALEPGCPRHLPGSPLTVAIWQARRPSSRPASATTAEAPQRAVLANPTGLV